MSDCSTDVTMEGVGNTIVPTPESQPERTVIIKKSCHEFEVTTPSGIEPPVVEGSVAIVSNAGLREFQAEFDAADAILSPNASLIRRPDAVSFDYLTAYSIGPIAIGDVTAGASARIWRAVARDGTVYLTPANDANDGWGVEVALFNYTGEASEIDLAFEQAARSVVSLEIDGNIWIYWFDPVLSSFVLENLTTGRTPRLVLDDLIDTNNSDVLLFYIDSNTIKYRQQRDRYDIAIDTPITGIGDNYFLEDAFRTTDNRIAVIFSIRNAGKYSLDSLESTLYPFFPPADSLDLAQLIQSGLFELVVINITAEPEGLDLSQLIQSGILATPIVLYTSFDNDALDLSQLVQSGSLAVVVLTNTAFDNDAVDLSQAIQSGTLVAVVITYTAFDLDGLDVSQLIQSGTLAP